MLLSPRLTPSLIGMGLLEAIPAAAVLAAADPDDRNGDGISGRANQVWDEVAGRAALGRFGWKANIPTLTQQVAAAYHNDMGITSPRFPTESVTGQSQVTGPVGPPEIDADRLKATVHYLRTLAVPDRRAIASGQIRRGALLFNQANCVACHMPTQRTGAFPDAPEVGRETIHPYTDLLLHDMGAGLADGRPDFLATGSEWRTAPLWGLGLRAAVQGQLSLLHDGRAHSVTEAILWHGGEAAAAKDTFRTMPRQDRSALAAFLNSL
ncbi:MAG: c-type cytochrome [Candidatus Sericytochromatia bacterium]|nr:c-type cytochrome [Candidatus Sericytochromatia bacterium]